MVQYHFRSPSGRDVIHDQSVAFVPAGAPFHCKRRADAVAIAGELAWAGLQVFDDGAREHELAIAAARLIGKRDKGLPFASAFTATAFFISSRA
jgi:hypothetical protein